MIIERQYVPFGILCERDSKSKEIFMKAFNDSYSKAERERIWLILSQQCLYEKDIGWAFRKLGDVIEGFEMLDKIHPYDNGYTLDDVDEVEIIEKQEEYINLHLINKSYDKKFIVKNIKIYNK